MTRKINKLLIANRGEIARRIVHSCQKRELRTVNLHWDKTHLNEQSLESDELVTMGGEALSESFLNPKVIIDAAKKCGADAIHPGYGFLSENADFIDAVEKAGLLFVGPSAKCVRLIGDKMRAREHAQSLNIPVVPGYHGNANDDKNLIQEAKKIGFPLMIKASAGGGGRGMRLVEREEEFVEKLKKAKQEAQLSFGDDQVFLEKFIDSGKHIEVQILADSHGNVCHLYERNCSVQRRHQKIIEEAPASFLSNELKGCLYEDAIKLAKSISYLGAGTIEYLVTLDEEYYFLEMNTRLQVEHPVTEMILGIDLVDLQFQMAEGEKIPFRQDELLIRGHAIEARVCAEDPKQSYLPSSGLLERCSFSGLPNARWDSAYRDGDVVGTEYDSMMGKMICWDHSKEGAARALTMALKKLDIVGVCHNREQLLHILRSEVFLSHAFATNTLEQQDFCGLKETLSDDLVAVLVAAGEYYNTFEKGQNPSVRVIDNPWASSNLQGFRNS